MVPLADYASKIGLLPRLRRPALRSRATRARGVCELCGEEASFRFFYLVSDRMVSSLGLSAEQRLRWNRRESMLCASCGMTFRGRQMARALLELYGTTQRGLKQLLGDASFRELRILGIDDPLLAPVLRNHPGYTHFEYIAASTSPAFDSKPALPWPDGAFELVLSTDFLEHMPDHRHAMSEIRRVLSPGGVWLACLPLMPERRTTTRATAEPDGSIRHLLPPAYHHADEKRDGFVYTEFSLDFPVQVAAAGFAVTVLYQAILEPDYTPILVCRRR